MPENDTNILHILYHRMIGERPEAGAKDFIRHLSWIGGSFALAKLISSLVKIDPPSPED